MKNKIDIENGRYWDRALSLVDGCTPCSPGYVPAGRLLDGRTHDDLPWINLADDGKGREADHE